MKRCRVLAFATVAEISSKKADRTDPLAPLTMKASMQKQVMNPSVAILCAVLGVAPGCGDDSGDVGVVGSSAGPQSASSDAGGDPSGGDETRDGDGRDDDGGTDDGTATTSATSDPSDSTADTADDTGPHPAGLIFSEDFDDRPDWSSTRASSCSSAASGCQDDVPVPWDLMYLDQPSVTDVGPTCEISSAGAIGGSGKGLRFVDDARGRKNAWKADCQLVEHLGDVHPDLYFKFDILWNSDMTMEDYNAAKIFRAGYYLPGYFDGTESSSIFSTADSTRGMVFIDLQRGGSAPDYEAKFKAVYRCNPGYKADCRDTSDRVIGPWDSTVGDGEPHTVVFRMKINTDFDSNGVFQAWWDGELIVDEQAIQWTTSDINLGGFNTFSVGGNQDHNWGCGSGFPDDEMCTDESQEWKHNIDNVKVGTTWDAVQ